MKSQRYLPLILGLLPLLSSAQHIKPGYVDWGVTGPAFPETLTSWQKGQKWSDDDNFFISRVKAKLRFRNSATQVNPALDETNDKKLIFWVPVNNPDFNALPDGVFDSEVFPMWSYITHYGNWTTPLVRMPGNFIDAAHKNGVSVSVVASVPYGTIPTEWKNALNTLVNVGPEKMADFLEYYGVDGLGYNSEFRSDASLPKNLANYHLELINLLKPTGRMPLAENIWYDGTDINGNINFDNGLGDHNINIWGFKNDIKTSLFFNYNWTSPTLLSNSVLLANNRKRTPLDLYCGFNLQGKEPKYRNNGMWTLLAEYPLSIGLWGAHSQNMFFESRAEKGTAPEDQQRTYLLRMERWFTGGTRNPVNSLEINNSLKVVADNYDFFGMSKLMSARSALSWDLGEEPFITYFNLGNGKFFNYEGVRRHSSEWYNIGMQDYLPTWMWWFSEKFLGRNPGDVPSSGLDAEFVWDDAWMGGSLVRIFGSTPEEYLHLFKTQFGIRRGDVITLRYKVISGSADAYLALSVKGNEDTPTDESKFRIMKKSETLNGVWQTVSFTVNDELSALEDKDLAMIALHFKDADGLDLRLGEFSIVRGNDTSATPATPVIERAELLASNKSGADGKIIFNMPNDKGNDVCYNLDVKTSLFKLYAKQPGKQPVLMGMTPSWAGLIFSAPVDLSADSKMKFGVSALSLDMKSESEIAWSSYFDLDTEYEYCDDIYVDKPVIATGDKFIISYKDPRHEPGNWALKDSNGKIVASMEDAPALEIDGGLNSPGNYDLTLTGMVQSENGREEITRSFPGFIQIHDDTAGRLPEIISLSANGEESGLLSVDPGAVVEMEYQGNDADGSLSRGVRVDRYGLGFRMAEAGYSEETSFSISFWIKPDGFDNNALHLFSIRDKLDKWANNNWGWFWHTLNDDGSFAEFTLRSISGSNIVYDFGDVKLIPGVWQHIAYVFDFDKDKALLPSFYLNGKKVTLRSYSRDNRIHEGDEIIHENLLYPWRENNVAAIGGYLHNSGSVRGNIDNLMYWNKALAEDEVKLAMGDIDSTKLPEGLDGLFDFEKDADENGTFANTGLGSFAAGSHTYKATEVEGQGTFAWVQPEYCPGTPILKGEGCKIATRPVWITPGAEMVTSSGDGKNGKATLRFPCDGRYKIELQLANDYGHSSKSFTIGVGTGSVNSIVDDTKILVSPNPFETDIEITVGEGGAYEFNIYDMEGKLLSRDKADISAGGSLTLHPDVERGVYLLGISRDGRLCSTFKLIRR